MSEYCKRDRRLFKRGLVSSKHSDSGFLNDVWEEQLDRLEILKYVFYDVVKLCMLT